MSQPSQGSVDLFAEFYEDVQSHPQDRGSDPVPDVLRPAKRRHAEEVHGEGDGGGDQQEEESVSLAAPEEPQMAQRKKYKKRKGLLTQRPQKRKKSSSKVDAAELTSSENVGESDTTDQATEIEIIDTTPAEQEKPRKKYHKMKNRVGKKRKQYKHSSETTLQETPVRMDADQNPLNISSAFVECNDGDDHLEYEFIKLSPEFKPLCTDNIPLGASHLLLMDDFSSETAAIEVLTFHLQDSLREASSKWTVDCKHDMCRLSLLSDSENVAVERAIVWSRERGIFIFVHNKPLPADSFLLEVEISDFNNISDVAQHLQNLCALVETASLCQAVTTYDQYWESAEASKIGHREGDSFQGFPRFRSSDCALIYVEQIRCPSCDKLKQRFKARQLRASRIEGKNLKKINNRYLTWKQLGSKTAKLAAENKGLKIEVARLRKKIKKLIEKDSVPVDQELSQEFFTIVKKNASKMTPIQKLVWSEQMKAISRQKNPRCMRWSPMMIKIALHIQSLSPTTYNYLRESGVMKLPSQRRLFDFSHFCEAKTGVQDSILDLLSEKLSKIMKEPHQEFFNLLFDEMNVRAGLVTTKNGDLVGFESLSSVEESIKELEAELAEDESECHPKVAKKILAFMLQGISLDIHEVVAIYPTTDLTAQQLYTRSWDVVYCLESRTIKILCLICDGAACNKKFMEMHSKWDPTKDFVYATRNIASGEERPIFFIIDPPHLLKTIRNCLSNSYGHKNSRNMWMDGDIISWEAIELLFTMSIKDKFKRHKLTLAHIKLTAFSRMTVKYATQTMSRSVATSLSDYKDDERSKGLITPALITFLLKTNQFFDCLNGSNDPSGTRNKSNRNLLPYTSVDDSRLVYDLKEDMLKFFQDWHKSVFSREGDFSKEERERMMISSQSYESLHITIYGFCGAVEYLLRMGALSVDAKKFNQDKLEQYFGILRMLFGANNNPTVQNVAQKTRALTVQRGAAIPAKKGNVSAQNNSLEINQEPLPSRKP